MTNSYHAHVQIEYHFEFTGTASEIDAVLFFKKLLTPTLRNSLKYTYREEEMAMMTVNEVSKLTGLSMVATPRALSPKSVDIRNSFL